MSEPAPLLNVLLVSGGGFQGLAVLKGLLRADRIRVVIADRHGENIGRYFAHRYCVVPPIAGRDAFLKALSEICQAERIHVIFPCTEFELEILAEQTEMFAARGIRLAVSSVEFLKRVRDKKELYAFLKQEGLPVLDVVDPAAPGVRFPVLGKPRNGFGGKGQIILPSAEALQRHSPAELKERYVWQPLLRDFVEYSIDFAISLHGAVSEVCVRERVRVTGGFAVVSRYRDEKRVAEIAGRFAAVAARHGGRGIFNLQILQAGDGCFISDVNPRIGTSAVSGDVAGVNLPAFVCSPETAAQPGPPRAGRKPVTMVRYLDEVFVENEDLTGVRGVVFDLDDTLLHQKRWILDKLRGLYPAFQSKLPDANAFLARAIVILEEGNRSRLIDALGEHFGLSAALCRELIDAYRKVSPPDAPVYADVRPLVAELKRRGYRLAILTNNPPASQRQKIAAAGFQDGFDEIIYAQECNAEKPAPEGFRHVAGRLKLKPEELVMVGDNLYGDILGALDAGYRHGFLMVRPGGFFNFDVNLLDGLPAAGKRFTVMTSLRDILRHLGDAA